MVNTEIRSHSTSQSVEELCVQDSSAAELHREESPLGGVRWHDPHQTWQRRGEVAARPRLREAGGKEAAGPGWAGGQAQTVGPGT